MSLMDVITWPLLMLWKNRTLKRPVCIWKKGYTGSEGRDPGTAFYEHLIEYHLCTYKNEPVRCEPVLFL
mgnify:CR=1 FL=1